MQKEANPRKSMGIFCFRLSRHRKVHLILITMEAITSADGYIMDGHHRWAARTLLDPGAAVKVS
jgi:hypothetical protein